MEDLELARLGSTTPDHTFQNIYSIIMNFLLAVLFAGLSEYVILQPISRKPIIEIAAIIGGNLSLYYKTQRIIGKVMIWVCHHYKIKTIERRSENEVEITVA